MAVFTYAARDSKGALVEGDINAPTPSDVAKLLRNEGKFVVRVAPKGAAPAKKRTPPTTSSAHSLSATGAPKAKAKPSGVSGLNNKYRPDDLIFFTNQLAVLIETGVSLAEALEACMHEGNSPRFARALDAIYDKVQGGCEFSSALADHPRIFAQMYVTPIKASEASDTMGPMLARLANPPES